MTWIKVKNGMPGYGKKVLAYDLSRIYIAFRKEETEYNEHWTICEDQNCSCVGCTGPIVCWTYLPELPDDLD